MTELASVDAVALMPMDSPRGSALVRVRLEYQVDLPLFVLWPASAPSGAVRRVRDGMSVTAAAPPPER